MFWTHRHRRLPRCTTSLPRRQHCFSVDGRGVFNFVCIQFRGYMELVLSVALLVPGLTPGSFVATAYVVDTQAWQVFKSLSLIDELFKPYTQSLWLPKRLNQVNQVLLIQNLDWHACWSVFRSFFCLFCSSSQRSSSWMALLSWSSDWVRRWIFWKIRIISRPFWTGQPLSYTERWLLVQTSDDSTSLQVGLFEGSTSVHG